jgi:hypothetical protein
MLTCGERVVRAHESQRERCGWSVRRTFLTYEIGDVGESTLAVRCGLLADDVGDGRIDGHGWKLSGCRSEEARRGRSIGDGQLEGQ